MILSIFIKIKILIIRKIRNEMYILENAFLYFFFLLFLLLQILMIV